MMMPQRRLRIPSELETLFRSEYHSLVAALTVMAADQDVAADAVQDAFLAAHRHWRRIKHYEDKRGWLRRVAVNRLIDDRRRTSRFRHLAATRGGDGSRTFAYQAPEDPDLLAAVQALPRQQRLTVCLFYLADLSVEEVAETLDLAPGTVKSHLHDARRSLAIALKEDHPDVQDR